MKRDEYSLHITRIGNAYTILPGGGDEWIQEEAYQDDEDDDLKAIEEVLNRVVEYFGKYGTRYDKERICVRREPGDKYESVEGIKGSIGVVGTTGSLGDYMEKKDEEKQG